MKHKRLSLRLMVGGFVLGAAGLLAAVGVEANNIRWFISPSDPYLQDWSDTTSISTDDNWDNFIAILGYRGDGLTAAVGADPQTILADGATTPLDVIANQSNPNTLTTGGVAEFDGIPNPTVALKGSATADAPHLVIQLNKESCPDSKFITVSYRVRDLDSTANDAVQAVALQYRVGASGDYINVPGAFVADATDPNQATRVTSVFGQLPFIANGLDLVNIRIITANAAGNDEWVGIDDINIGCYVTTAAESAISGRVIGTDGNAVPRALVTFISNSGTTHTARTNSFGYYRFDAIPGGTTYVAGVSARGLTFNSQVVTVADDIRALDFYAVEPSAPVLVPETSAPTKVAEAPRGRTRSRKE